MDDTRETLPQREEVLETSSEDVSDDAGSRLTESPGSAFDSSGEYGTAIAIFGDDPHEAFSEDIELFLDQAEGAIARHRFDLRSAQTLVLKLRELGQTYASKGCTESDMKVIVIKRILITVEQVVVLNQVNTDQTGIYDPRQTMTYLLCAILQEEVEEAVCSLKEDKSPGGDTIPAELLKHRGPELIKALTTICQRIWDTKQWPTEWTKSMSIPIPKKAT